MAKTNDIGVFKKSNGCWEYRFVFFVDGKRFSRKKSTDLDGNKLYTKKQAIAARKAAIEQTYVEHERQTVLSKKTVLDVFDAFRETGRFDRAYQTIRKQDSIY